MERLTADCWGTICTKGREANRRLIWKVFISANFLPILLFSFQFWRICDYRGYGMFDLHWFHPRLFKVWPFQGLPLTSLKHKKKPRKWLSAVSILFWITEVDYSADQFFYWGQEWLLHSGCPTLLAGWCSWSPLRTVCQVGSKMHSPRRGHCTRKAICTIHRNTSPWGLSSFFPNQSTQY